MKIVCPECSAQYDLPAGAIGEKGRKVKCASCQANWRAFPLDEDQEQQLDSAEEKLAVNGPVTRPSAKGDFVPVVNDVFDAAEEAADGADDSFGDEQVFDEAEEAALDAELEEAAADADADQDLDGKPKPDSYEARSDDEDGSEPAEDEDAQESPEMLQKRREALQKRHAVLARNLPRSRIRRISRLVAAIALMTVALGSYVFRDPMVRAYPELATLYGLIGVKVNVMGLSIDNVSTVRALRDGVEVLQIDAELSNITGHQVSVPRVNVELKDADGVLLYEWNATPQVRVLRPSESVEFSTALALPPLEAVEIRLGFFEGEEQGGS